MLSIIWLQRFIGHLNAKVFGGHLSKLLQLHRSSTKYRLLGGFNRLTIATPFVRVKPCNGYTVFHN